MLPVELLQSLAAGVQESLAGYLYPDAIELAQQLFHLEPSHANLHLLAHCHVVSGAVATAYRLLQHHFPFIEVHVTRPRTAGGAPGSSGTMGGGGPGAGAGSALFAVTASASAGSTSLSATVNSASALPLDARRTWTTSSSVSTSANASSGTEAYASQVQQPQQRHGSPLQPGSGSSTGFIDISEEVVDLQSQWECQYLLGVCCVRTRRYEEGARLMSQLMFVNHQVTTTAGLLRRRLQQLPPQQQSRTAEEEVAVRDAERQLRSYEFLTDARASLVSYWLGLCEKHRQRPPIAAEHLRRAFAAHPTRVDAFYEYVHLAWPSEGAVQSLLAVKEALVEEEEDGVEAEDEGRDEYDAGADVAGLHAGGQQQHQQRPPQRRGRAPDAPLDVDAEEADERRGGDARWRARPFAAAAAAASSTRGRTPADAPRAVPSGPRLTAGQRRCLQHHLRPLLHAAYLGLIYRCSEAVEALSALLVQEEQLQRDVAVAATAAAIAAGSQSSSSLSSTWSGSLSTGGARSSSGSTLMHAARLPSGPSPLLLGQLALAQFHNGDVQESADTFGRLLQAAPWELTSPALVFYSTALWHLKNEGALGSLAQRLTDAEPFSATTLCVVANAYSLVKDPRDALVMLRRAVQVAPTMAYAHALLGYELLGQDSKAEAEAAFKSALAADASLYIAYAGLGERHMREEQVERARGYYREAVRLNPTPAIMNRFALTYHRQGKSMADLKTALRLYTESLERHPSNVTARRQRADVLLRLDQPKEALEELKALLVQCPGEAVVYVTLAECMVCLRRPQEALQHYQTAMHLDPHRESYVQGCIDQLVAAGML